MKKESAESGSMDIQTGDNRTGCLGEFDGKDQICKSLCALRLRCAIEKERNLRMELLEELVSAEQLLTEFNNRL